MPEKMGICFVCLGNIVRSPLAEHMFRFLAEKAGVAEKYEIDSAGTGSWHLGESPDSRMRRVAALHGLVYDGKSRLFTEADLNRFDLILVMDHENFAAVNSMARDEQQMAKIRMLREFDPQANGYLAVPDPYYGGVQGFEEVYQIIERSVGGLLAELENNSEQSA